MAEQVKTFDEQGRAVLEEYLAFSCTEEIAVFQAFSRIIQRQAVCRAMDTAPTGHIHCYCLTPPALTTVRLPDRSVSTVARTDAHDAPAGQRADESSHRHAGGNHAGVEAAICRTTCVARD